MIPRNLSLLLRNQKLIVTAMSSRNLSSSAPTVIAEEKGNAGVITLNRPRALHSLNLEMVQ